MSGNGAYPEEMDFTQPEIATFSRALRATLVREPDPARSVAMVRRLADEARASATVAAERAQRTPTAPLPSGRRASPRRRLALVALAVAMVPLLTAGLAVAGVHLPAAAENAFETVGIDLPNQGDSSSDDPADHDQGSGNDGEPAASPAAEPGSEKAVKGDKQAGQRTAQPQQRRRQREPGLQLERQGQGQARGPARPERRPAAEEQRRRQRQEQRRRQQRQRARAGQKAGQPGRLRAAAARARASRSRSKSHLLGFASGGAQSSNSA